MKQIGRPTKTFKNTNENLRQPRKPMKSITNLREALEIIAGPGPHPTDEAERREEMRDDET